MYLGYNNDNKRYGILWSDEWNIKELHCGQVLQVEIDGKWVDTRLEYDESSTHSHGWYLVGLKGVPLERLEVRFGEQ